MITEIQNKVSDLLLSLDPKNLPKDQFIGVRTLSAPKDTIRISRLMKAYPGATPERIAKLHLENCLERDYWYMFEVDYD